MIAALAPLVFALGQAPPAAPAPQAKRVPSGPVVVLETSLGTIRIALDKEKAPLTVENFLKYVRARHYDGTIFHRVIPNFMAQGGGFGADMVEKPTRPPIRNEARNGLRNSRGTVAMARTSDPHSASAQFFINVKDNHRLDFGIGGAGYAVFGEVVEGLDIADRISVTPTTTRRGHENAPQTSVVIRQARELKTWTPPTPPPAAEPPKP